MKRYRKCGRKVGWIGKRLENTEENVKWYGKYGWNVKWYGKYGRKVSWKVKRFGKYRRKLWNDMENKEEKWMAVVVVANFCKKCKYWNK